VLAALGTNMTYRGEGIARISRVGLLQIGEHDKGGSFALKSQRLALVEVSNVNDGALRDVDAALISGTGASLMDATKELRQSGYPHPILLVQRAPFVSAVELLERGADDVLLSPVDVRELSARLQSLVRRGPLRWIGDDNEFVVDETERIIRIRSAEIRLSPLPFRLLHYLVQHRGRWISRKEILESVFETHHDPTTSLVRFHVYTIRKALGGLRDCLREDRVGVRGYRFDLLGEEAWRRDSARDLPH
jgi:DNA-binding response OmpR family regulator